MIIKVFGFLIFILLILVALLEMSLRLFLGLGNPLIYVADDGIGYLLAPNQKLRRFGNDIEINQYSMRSKQIEKTRKVHTIRIILLGDSIANGAWWTDQQKTISSLIENQLGDLGTKIEVLNASANSWGPRNQLAYLQRFGTFDAQIVILLLNTDDLFALAPNSLIVGNDPNYPDHKPVLALMELWQRLIPTQNHLEIKPETGDRVGFNLKAIEEIYVLSKQNQAEFMLGMTPLQREVKPPYGRDYEKIARERLLSLVTSQNMMYLDFLLYFQKDSHSDSLYRDHIHLSSFGNQLVSEMISQNIHNLEIND